MRFYDISIPLHNGLAPYPGDPPFTRRPLTDCAKDGFLLSELSMTSHTGTHLDAPAHILPDGKTLDQYPPERFYLKALVVEWDQTSPVLPEALVACDLTRVQAVLFKTPNSALSDVMFSSSYTYIHYETAHLLVKEGIQLVGIDYGSVDAMEDHDLATHHILLKGDVLILENTNLSAVASGEYTLICLPLSIFATDGAPCRAILTDE